MKWNRIKELYNDNRLAAQILGAALLAIFVTLLSAIISSSESSATREAPTEKTGLDTFVPAGTVYIPIDVQNIDSLDSVFGQYGLVDLYRGDGQKRNRLVVSGIRMLRAPLNPRSFGVICPDTEKDLVVGDGSPFFVVLRHPESDGTRFEKAKDRGKAPQLRRAAKTSRIHYLE